MLHQEQIITLVFPNRGTLNTVLGTTSHQKGHSEPQVHLSWFGELSVFEYCGSQSPHMQDYYTLIWPNSESIIKNQQTQD